MKLNLDGTTILITGASSGIGRDLAKLVAPRAGQIILVARRLDRLQELKSEISTLYPKLKIKTLSCDLSKIHSIDILLKEAGNIDILINNAGMGDFSLLENASWPKLEQMFNTNMLAPAYLCQQLLPGMLTRGKGGILNISSLAGFMPFPGFASYNSSKFFLNCFTESLRAELSGTNIVISQLCPGPVKTEFESVASNGSPAKVPKWAEISSLKCAQIALKGFTNAKPIIVPGFFPTCFLSLYLATPNFLKRPISALLGRWIRHSPLFLPSAR